MKPENYTKNQIIFGSGGGFANLVNEYRLLDNGRLFHKTSIDVAFKKLKKPTTEQTKTFFETANKIFNPLEEKGEPANMYYFLKLKQGSEVKEVVWGRGEAPAQAKKLYKELISVARSDASL